MVNNLWAKQDKMMTLFFPFLQHKIVVFSPEKTSTFFLTGGFLAANTDTYLVTLLEQSCPVLFLCYVVSPLISWQRPQGSQSEVVLRPLQGTNQVLHTENILICFNMKIFGENKNISPAGQSHCLAELDRHILRLGEKSLTDLSWRHQHRHHHQPGDQEDSGSPAHC